MLQNYLKIAFRSILKFKAYSFINLFGLGLGLTSAILILIYVLDELSFDKFHTNREKIYRVGTDMTDVNTGALNGSVEANGWPVGKLLLQDFPEVEQVTYIANASNLQVNHDTKRFDERIFFASPEFLDIFTFPLSSGNPETVLVKPYSLVLTETIAKKYFGSEDALGKTLVLADTIPFVVTGVMKDIPKQSHMQFGMLISFATYETMNSWFSYDGGWGNLNVRNYITLKDGADREAFFTKAKDLYMTYVKEEMKSWGMYMYVKFEPLSQIYLRTTRGNGMGPLGSMDRVYVVSGIAFFVVLLACINFINLSTARSTYRAKEVGLRKVSGSTRRSLIKQFLSESLLLSLLAFVIALALIGLVLPLFNQLVGKDYSLLSLTHPMVITGVASLLLGITLLAGYYPAWVMSGLRPAEVLKGNHKTSSRGVQLRRVLVVIQFMISASLIICTLVVIDQLDFMQNRDLGFSGRQVLVLDMDRVTDRGGSGGFRKVPTDVFKNELEQFTSIESVSFTNAVPGRPGWVGQWAHAEERHEEGSIGMEYMTIDEDYLKTLGLSIIAGRNFDLNRISELEDGLIINETAVVKLGWENPENAIGKRIDSPSKHPAGEVIGVVRDYHEFGLQREIYPMAMDYNPTRSRYFAIRFKTTGTADFVTNLEKLWKKYFDGYEFKYFFLDENFERQYQSEQKLAKVFTTFSVITILIASIGLIGLVSFMVVTKTKEIGIRKILGAGVFNITRMLSKEFMILTLVANAIACPLAWYFMSQWLEKFAYRTTIGFELFAFTFIFGLLATFITVSFQTIRAAMADPVKSLRYE